MVRELQGLSATESDRIYTEEIRPYHLGGVDRSSTPTLVLVGGAPGSGKTVLVPQVAAELATRTGTPVVLSVDEMREHHPGWQRFARTDPHAAERYNADASSWVNRLMRDAITEHKNVVLETGFKDAALLRRTVSEFKEAGYKVEAVILAVDEQRTRRSVVARYLDAHDRGNLPRIVAADRHQQGYEGLRETLKAAEHEILLDHLKVTTREGRILFENRSRNGTWEREEGAVRALDQERDKPLTASEKVNNAIAWHELSSHTRRVANMPPAIISQTEQWREDASARVNSDPEAAKQYSWRLAAESFRSMSRDQFLREFPTYVGAVDRLDKAAAHARTEYAEPANQDAFVTQAKEKLAAQIAEGRQFGRLKTETLSVGKDLMDHAQDGPNR